MSKEETAAWNLARQDFCGNITLELQDKIEGGSKYYIQFTAFHYETLERNFNCSSEVITELHTHRKVSNYIHVIYTLRPFLPSTYLPWPAQCD